MKTVTVNICRFIVALTFVASGFLKAIDPLGTQYKISEYLSAWGLGGKIDDFWLLSLAVALAAAEFSLGLFLLFAIHRRTVTRLLLLMMAVMTPISLWLALTDGVSDCGCFGEALKLTGRQTLAKNIILLLSAAVIARWPLLMTRFISRTNQWIVVNFTVCFIIALSLWCLYDLPLLDFRPYHVGADLRAEMSIPKDAPAPRFEWRFIMEKEGKRETFTLDDYPDSTWTLIEAESVQTAKGYEPPVSDFSIETDEGTDITESVIADTGYTFLLVAPFLETADDSRFDLINTVYDYAREHGYPFYCLTASGDEARRRWRAMTGAEYPFCTTDETTLKTIIRSNPGLVLLKDGKVFGKWSHNFLPKPKDTSPALNRMEMGQIKKTGAPRKISVILLWYFLPLLLLTIADRLWAWTRIGVRRKKKSKPEENPDAAGQTAADPNG